MKQRKASSGVQTIGSPRTLKLVLTRTGQPVFALKREISCVEARVGVGVHGLHARGVIDMRDGRDIGARDVELVDAEQRLLLVGHRAAALAPHVRDQQHVGRVRVELEPVGDVLAQHRRREGAKTLAIFDAQIERLLHRR